MALVRSFRLSPNLRLIQAISNFRNELSAEQQIQLQEYGSRIPSMDDVMSLTEEIDRLATSRITEFRRCYGPRMTNFLDGVQEFAKAADIAVGASKSTTASAVWAAAGTSASTPYIDQLSSLFLNLGRSAHRFRDMALLYPRSKGLQDALFEYYIIIVQMCCEILKLSKKSNLARYWTTFAEESYTARLDKCAKNIIQEITLENNRRLEQERRENIVYRAFSRQHLEIQKHHQQQMLNKKILDNLSKHKFKTTWKQTRDLGTTMLFNNSEAYQEWKRTRKSCTLLYSGKLGSGKSVLLANIVGDLHLEQAPPSQVVYFFCKHDIQESLSPRTIFGCIARQLLLRHSDLGSLTNAIDTSSPLEMEDVLELIKNSTTDAIHFVLDGIDNCSLEARGEILTNLKHLQQHLTLMVCISTRDQHNQFWNPEPPPQHLLMASIPEQNSDIDAYIDREIDDQLRNQSLIVNDNALVDKVKRTLKSRAEGMFLWVHLQILCLCLMENDHDVEQALENMPRGLAETYQRLLQHQPKSRYRHRLFELVLAAYEPLTTSQLREALSVEVGNTNYDPKKLLNSIDRVINACAGLIVVDEEEETVMFVHHTVDGFLTSSAYEQQLNKTAASAEMGLVILTYLNYSLLETQIAIRKDPALSTGMIPAGILMSVLPQSARFTKPSRNRALDRSLLTHGQNIEGNQTPYLVYAKAYWIPHFMGTKSDDETCHILLQSALGKGKINIQDKWNDETPLEQSIKQGRADLLPFFLEEDPNQEGKISALYLAVSSENTSIILIALKRCSEVPFDTLFRIAIETDSLTLFNILFKFPFEIEKMKININAEFESMWNYTPLAFSIECNATLIFSMLLGQGSIAPYQVCHGMIPITHAIKLRRISMVRIFTSQIQPNYSIVSEESLWETTLATSKRDDAVDEELLTLLLKNKWLSLNVLLTSPDSWVINPTPLMRASSMGLYGMVKSMLEFDDSNINERQNHAKYLAYPARTTERRWSDTAWDQASNNKIRTLLEKHGGMGLKEIDKRKVSAQNSSRATVLNKN